MPIVFLCFIELLREKVHENNGNYSLVMLFLICYSVLNVVPLGTIQKRPELTKSNELPASPKPASLMKKNNGFTLIELMITVAVVGILAAVAYPSYLDQVRKARRAEAQAVLMNIAARQQQMLLDTRSYASTTGALNITVPATVLNAYGVAITVGTAAVPSFTATATPSGSQARDKCGSLSITQTGAKSPTTCW